MTNTHVNITNIVLGEKYRNKQTMLETLAVLLTLEEIKGRIPKKLVTEALSFSLGEIDTIVKNGKNLSFTQTLGGMLHVVFATNNLVRNALCPNLSYEEALAKGSYFLTLMAAKETFVGLTSEEVAGLVAACQTDIVYQPALPSVFETSGMGADRGWGSKDVKTINASTLTAFVLASMGHTSMKHGSYGNTTKVGSTDVPEKFGADITIANTTKIQQLLDETNFWFNDAHSVKTIHYLSHLLMVETINHVVGPMTAPIAKETKLFKVLGVNHNVHPNVIAKAYVHLHTLGLINLGGVIVIGGVDKKPNSQEIDDPAWFKQYSRIDEFNPEGTLLSMAAGGNFLGNRVIDASTFGVTIDESSLMVQNTLPTLLKANEEALRGGVLAEYLACNVAIALATKELENGFAKSVFASNFALALDAIIEGKPLATLKRYVEMTGGVRKSWI